MDSSMTGGPIAAAPVTDREWKPELGAWSGLVLALPMIVLLGLMVFYPLVKLAWDSLTQGDGIGNYVRVLSMRSTRRAISTTFIDSLIVTVIVMIVGGVIAWYLRGMQSRWARITVWSAVFVPFWMGSVVKTYALVLFLGNTGLLNSMLGFLGLPPLRILYTPAAVVYGIVYSMIPFAVFTMFAVFRTIEESLLQAAQGLGASRTGALVTVMMPIALPGIIASSAVVFALTIGYYVTPVVLGGAQAPFVATVISQEIFMYFDYPAAATLSVILIIGAIAALGVAMAFVGPERIRRAVTR